MIHRQNILSNIFQRCLRKKMSNNSNLVQDEIIMENTKLSSSPNSSSTSVIVSPNTNTDMKTNDDWSYVYDLPVSEVITYLKSLGPSDNRITTIMEKHPRAIKTESRQISRIRPFKLVSF